MVYVFHLLSAALLSWRRYIASVRHSSSVSVLNDISKKNGQEVELKAEEVEGRDEAPTEF